MLVENGFVCIVLTHYAQQVGSTINAAFRIMLKKTSPARFDWSEIWCLVIEML